MDKMKVLLVEDSEEEVGTFNSTKTRYQHEKTGRQIETETAKNLSEARERLNNTFDGAIIDLKLGPEGYEGNNIIKEIATNYRIPIVVLTGHPRDAPTDVNLLHVFTRGETGYDQILDLLFSVYDTGLTRIFGGRGDIEDAMNRIFWDHILPDLKSWQQNAREGENAKNGLLRFTIGQLFELLNNEETNSFPEEMYIIPPFANHVQTGNIVRCKDSDQRYIVLSPACDLALRKDGKPKTDVVLVCYIENLNDLKLNKESFEKVIKNNHTPYFHYLPQTAQFAAGAINFRKVSTYLISEFDLHFEKPIAQVSMAFLKDIVARFSSYYARQGQPDFNFTKLLEKYS